MPDINDQWLIIGFGSVFFALGVTARLGLWKGWYWNSRKSAYGYIPVGLAFLTYNWRPEIEAFFGSEVAFYVIFVLLFIVGGWWSLSPPNFVKPFWIRWIEEQPHEVQEAMHKQVKNDEEWRSRVTSRRAVEQWARSIR